MPNINDKKLKELESKIKILEQENEMLSERSEETLLLRLVAESTALIDDPKVLFETVLERISVLKDIPYCSCFEIIDGKLDELSIYRSFISESIDKDEIRISSKLIERLDDGSATIENGMLEKAEFYFKAEYTGFEPYNVTLIPYQSKMILKGVFIFIDEDKTKNRLSGMIMLLQNIVDMTIEKIDKIFLVSELRRINEELDRRVEDRTKELELLHNQNVHFSKTAAKIIMENDEKRIFEIISQTIVKFSDYNRVLISYFTDEPPYRIIIGYCHVNALMSDKVAATLSLRPL